MSISRREVLRWFGGTYSAFAMSRIARARGGAVDPFQPTRSSLRSYQVPEWFRDAKFGIWSHWGPQSAIEDGDWYARNMYMQGSEQYQYHVSKPTAIPPRSATRIWSAFGTPPNGIRTI